MKLLLKLSFVGTAYCGFQCQKNGKAVQNVLTDAAEKVFGEKCNITGCSRTDSGVHALGFCVTVAPTAIRDGWCSIPLEKMGCAFRNHLPDDISVVGAAWVSDEFHPRYYAKGKNYIYRIWDLPYDNPFEKGRSLRNYFPITGEKYENMSEAAEHFIGKKDFMSFMAAGSKITDTVRCVTESRIYREESGCLVFSVSADGFLYNMVRIMTGTLLLAASGKILPGDIDGIIDGKNRGNAGMTVPPEGLYLSEVFYDEKIDWK